MLALRSQEGRHAPVVEEIHGWARPLTPLALVAMASKAASHCEPTPVSVIIVRMMASRAPLVQPHPVNLNHPALTCIQEVCARPPSAPPPRHNSIDVFVNCFRIAFTADAPTEYFKYDVSTVSRPRARPPQQAPAAEATAAACEGPTNAPPCATVPAAQATAPSHEEGQTADAAQPSARVLPRKLPKRLMRVIVGELIAKERALFGAACVVHDGMASLYSPQRLDSGSDLMFENVVLSPSSGFRGAFDVTVKLVEAIPLKLLREYADPTHAAVNPLPLVQALNVVLRHYSATRCTASGQSLFRMKDPIPLSHTKELNLGVHMSVRVGNPALHLNVDTAAAVFYAPVSLLEFVVEIAQVPSARALAGCRDRWSNAICRLLVSFDHRRLVPPKPICEVGALGADCTMLVNRAGQPTCSVESYLKDRYNVGLKHPELPVVNVGSRRSPEWLPLELCIVAPGQPSKDQDGVDVAKIIQHSKKNPPDRKRCIQDEFDSASFENDSLLKAFGVQVHREMVVVAARRLTPPDLQVFDRRVTPENGQWNLSRDRLYRPRELVVWCVVNLSCLSIGDVERAVDSLVGEARRRGISVKDTAPPIICPGAAHGRDIEAMMREGFAQAKARHDQRRPDLIVVVKQQQDTEYNVIKRVSDTVLGVPSQCLLATKFAKARGQYLGNVVLKINMKLRGVNFALDMPVQVLTPAAICFGAGVDNNLARTGRTPAIYAVAASMDDRGGSFVGRTTPFAGLSSTLPRMLWELLVKYEEHQCVKPDRIFYFRDGVADGRMEDVYQAETKALHEAWLMFAPASPMPPIVFVIVSRRHHVRSFPASASSADRSGNTPAGCVLDQIVVDPRRYEFFLYSHNGLLGTSRPARYVVMRDDTNMRLVEMEQLCYDLCHVFGRATKSVSVVAPVYYAKIFAERGHCLVEYGAHDSVSTDSDTNSNGDNQGDFSGARPVINVHRELRDKLFCV